MRKKTALCILGFFAVTTAVMPALAQEKALSAGDQRFIKEAASGGIMEVQLGTMAQQKAQAQEIKDFGTSMVDHHGQANEELKKIAEQKLVALPARPHPKHKSMIHKLSKASGADFDKQYMQEMVKDHAKDVAEFRKAAQKVTDSDLQAWVGKTLPVLEEHLRHAKETARKIGVDVQQAEQAGIKEAEKKERKRMKPA